MSDIMSKYLAFVFLVVFSIISYAVAAPAGAKGFQDSTCLASGVEVAMEYLNREMPNAKVKQIQIKDDGGPVLKRYFSVLLVLTSGKKVEYSGNFSYDPECGVEDMFKTK